MPAGDVRAILAAWDESVQQMNTPPTYPRTTRLAANVDCGCVLEWESPGKAEAVIQLNCEHHGQHTVYFATLRASLGAP